MLRRVLSTLLVLGLAGLALLWVKGRGARPRPTLTGIGPRLISNQTSQPLALYGQGFEDGQVLELGPPLDRRVPLRVLDSTHAYARLPSVELPAHEPLVEVKASLQGGQGELSLRLANDRGFPDLRALAVASDGSAFAASETTDQVVWRRPSGETVTLAAGDGPTGLSLWTPRGSGPWLLVAHRFAPELLLINVGPGGAGERRTLPSPLGAVSVRVDGSTAYLAEQVRDTVVAIDLERGGELWRAPVAPNPYALEPCGDLLAVGSLQTGEVELLDRATGRVVASVAPTPKTVIAGGGTQGLSAYVMGGKAPRALACAPHLRRLFVASIGPNVGPNPQRHEVSMNGGVGVVDLDARAWVWHLGFGAGVTQALALDEGKGLLYAADVSLGLLRVLDARQLAAADGDPARALIQELAIPPNPGFPLVRPAEDFAVNGRAGPSLHSGPQALGLLGDGGRLFVLDRFTGTLADVDVASARDGKAVVVGQHALLSTLDQPSRRLGQVLYFADLGRTAMSCDACHLEGHTEGVLFEKTHPLRIYRSPTVRGSADTPPYFTPASTSSLEHTAKDVGSRNRFQNPPLTDGEVKALGLYSSTLTVLPNPFVGADGAPAEHLALPDGKSGRPRQGLLLFEGKAGCVECHPPPLFTTDQAAATRARYLDVGTPRALELRVELQETRFLGFAPPSLLGAWDVFPMLNTGAAGFGVSAESTLRVETRFALRAAVERWAPRHGRADLLTPEERDDLLAYLLSL